jgi:hypothetical protein
VLCLIVTQFLLKCQHSIPESCIDLLVSSTGDRTEASVRFNWTTGVEIAIIVFVVPVLLIFVVSIIRSCGLTPRRIDRAIAEADGMSP